MLALFMMALLLIWAGSYRLECYFGVVEAEESPLGGQGLYR